MEADAKGSKIKQIRNLVGPAERKNTGLVLVPVKSKNIKNWSTHFGTAGREG